MQNSLRDIGARVNGLSSERQDPQSGQSLRQNSNAPQSESERSLQAQMLGCDPDLPTNQLLAHNGMRSQRNIMQNERADCSWIPDWNPAIFSLGSQALQGSGAS